MSKQGTRRDKMSKIENSADGVRDIMVNLLSNAINMSPVNVTNGKGGIVGNSEEIGNCEILKNF